MSFACVACLVSLLRASVVVSVVAGLCRPKGWR